MDTPNYSPGQFVDSVVFNTAAGMVSGNFAALASGSVQPGLIRPDAVALTYSALAVTGTFNPPFKILFGSGVLAAAHGTQTNQDTQAYGVSFAGLVPASGSITAYLIASYQQIQQQPIQIIGPPVGHPDYNPNFSPYTAYKDNVDSIAVSASTAPPDNTTTFEIGRATLAAGATGIVLNTAYQQRAGAALNTQIVPVSGAFNVAVANAGRTHQFTGASGFAATLPLVAGANGVIYPFVSAAPGPVTVQTQGSDLIFGYGQTVSTGTSGISLQPGDAVVLCGQDGLWQVLGGTAGGVGVQGVPTGTVVDFAGAAAPGGWLLCAGQLVSRSTYAALFATVGTQYASGDGSTTFGLPDLRGRSTFGLDNMGGSAASRVTAGGSNITGTTLGAAGGNQSLQQHSHGVSDPTHVHGVNDSGHQHQTADGNNFLTGGSGLGPIPIGGNFVFNFQAFTNVVGTGIFLSAAGTGISIQNAGGGTTGSQNMPPAMMLNKIIKT